MPFRRGIDKVQESAERGSAFGGGRRYFKWDPGETKIIRFLLEGDEIVLTALHEFVQCVDNTKRSFVCRREIGEECELCTNPDVKRREVAYSIAVWREAVKTEGKTVFRTKTEEIEVDENGKKVKKVVPWVGILQQAPRNFWSWFWSAYDREGTLLNRDYSITRNGQGMETTYAPYNENEQEFDVAKVAEYKPDLEEMLTYLASREYYDAKLYGKVVEKDGETSSGTITDEDLEKLKKANEEITASAVISGDFD